METGHPRIQVFPRFRSLLIRNHSYSRSRLFLDQEFSQIQIITVPTTFRDHDLSTKMIIPRSSSFLDTYFFDPDNPRIQIISRFIKIIPRSRSFSGKIILRQIQKEKNIQQQEVSGAYDDSVKQILIGQRVLKRGRESQLANVNNSCLPKKRIF